jgi:putative transposase
MPWSESTKLDEKLRFVSRFLDGEKISRLCEEFGISRVTGHKIIERYKDSGLEAFTDRSRRPFHGLVKKKCSRRHPKLTGTNLSNLKEPNALWCVD